MSARIELAGAQIDALRRDAVVEHIFGALARGRGGWVITVNVDHLFRFTREAAIRELYAQADLVVADGMPLLWASWLQGDPLPERVAGSDLVWLLAERAARENRSLYLLGGDPGAAQEAATELRSRWPSLRIAGLSSPRLPARPDPTSVAELAAELVRAKPDLVYVALGAPKQEFAIRALRAALPSAWWLGVGISLSFIAGSVERAPRWLQKLGLEWAHRLGQEPGRLARRYLIDDLPFALRLLAKAALRRG